MLVYAWNLFACVALPLCVSCYVSHGTGEQFQYGVYSIFHVYNAHIYSFLHHHSPSNDLSLFFGLDICFGLCLVYMYFKSRKKLNMRQKHIFIHNHHIIGMFLYTKPNQTKPKWRYFSTCTIFHYCTVTGLNNFLLVINFLYSYWRTPMTLFILLFRWFVLFQLVYRCILVFWFLCRWFYCCSKYLNQYFVKPHFCLISSWTFQASMTIVIVQFIIRIKRHIVSYMHSINITIGVYCLLIDVYKVISFVLYFLKYTIIEMSFLFLV